MSCGRVKKPCRCGKASTVNLQRMSSIVRDIGDPCLSQSPMKVGQMLKPEKWRASFDRDGKVLAFRKALRLIILGGVDPSIRPEVWEFLLGCYALDSTAEFRRQLRKARRDRYSTLIRQCQMMNSSVGTGSLAYVVGSKVLDTRTSSKDDCGREDKTESRQTSIDSVNRLDNFQHLENDCTDMSQSQACQRESFTDSADLVSVRDNDVGAAYDTSTLLASSAPYTSGSQEVGKEANESQSGIQTYFDFSPLPVTNLCEEKEEDREEKNEVDSKFVTHDMFQMGDDRMHSFQITNNTDLVMEQNGFPSNGVPPINSEIEMVPPNACGTVSQSQKFASKTHIVSSLKISSIPESPLRGATSSQEVNVSEERVSEWRWTLHRIVVDVVRTDGHLEFYEDTRNLARMSDILAVYAWVDPATGYCQGMSDLLSPFVVLFEDNADAFWCFEMLLRRMRENFQMEGPTGVMKQLQVLWRILELTDREMFAHLSHIGAESLHFAFRMLLVLFRRELSFNDSLHMWEMMWAADFDESLQYNLEENCLDLLVIDDPMDLEADAALPASAENSGSDNSESAAQSKHGKGESSSENSGVKSSSTHPFCGLTKSFWSRNDQVPICSPASSTTKGGDRLSVFCVAAILIMNRRKVIRETHSFDDMIKIFNDNMLQINVKRCVRMAIKLRKKYFYKIIKSKNAAWDFDYCHASSPTS